MDNITDILQKIIIVLEKSSERDWLKTFKEINKNYLILKDDERAVYRRQLLQLYRGVGSFSDLVLYKNKELLYKENNELDSLRKDLFEELRRHL